MAQLFHEVLREVEFADKYRVVRFAVIEDHKAKSSTAGASMCGGWLDGWDYGTDEMVMHRRKSPQFETRDRVQYAVRE